MVSVLLSTFDLIFVPAQGKFDRVVLLAARGDAGGTVVYDSKPSNIPNYFSEGGSPVPEGENPADHLMYVLKDQGGDKWAQVWSDSESKQDTTALANEERKRLDTLRSNAADTKENMMTGSSTNLFSQCSFDNSDDEYPISYWDQYKALFIRTLHIWVADPQQGPLVLKMLAAINIILVLLLSGMTNNESKANCIFYWIVVQFAMSMTPLVIIMPQEKAIIMREYRNGVFSATMYWLARFTLAICHTIVVATFTTLFSYPLIGLPLTPFPSKLIRWWCFEFLYLSCVMMLGLTIGTLTKSPLGGLKAVIAVQLPWLVTAGVLPPTSMIRPSIFWMRYPNLFTWSAKLGLTIGFTNNGDKASETLLEGLGYHTGNADSCFQALALAFGITFLLGLGATHYALNKSDDSAGQRQEPAKKGDGKGMSPSKTEVEEKPSTMTNPLLGSQDSNGGYGAVDVEAPSTARSVPIEVRALSYRHQRSPDKVAINNVSLRVEPGSVTVLMGPSGAGKTTLLNLLSGRLPTGTYTTADGVVQPCLRGKVLVDDREAKFDVFKKIGTLTPQDEILSKDLTVRQTLLYTAELRSPRDWTYDKKEARVDEILKKLGLDEKACNVVGDPMSVGISGGQKKRLSIGMDLLAELPVMLVDEPTTGLDASSALSVVQTLITLASDQHRTIICTIHQPPWSMVLQFDKLVLLAGGNLIYDGVPAGLPDFLSDAGFPSPSNENPADYVMTVLVAEGTHKFLELRKNSRDEEGDDAPIDRHDEDDQVLTDEDFDALVNSDYPVSYLSQYTILVRRFAYTYVIDEEGLPETFFPAMMVGIVIGLAFHNFAVNSYLAVAVLTGCVAQGMLSLNTVVLMIPAERELVLREFRNGSYSVGAYWFARATISTAIAVCLGVPLMCVWWSLVGLPLDFHAIFHAWLSSTMNAGVFSLMGCVSRLPAYHAFNCTRFVAGYRTSLQDSTRVGSGFRPDRKCHDAFCRHDHRKTFHQAVRAAYLLRSLYPLCI